MALSLEACTMLVSVRATHLYKRRDGVFESGA